MKKYYNISQFDPQPANLEELNQLVDMDKATEVTSSFVPRWGAAVYVVDGDSIAVHMYNWDSSD